MGRKPYRTQCRFLNDDPTVGTVRWVEATPDAPVLDKVSIIYRREWDNDEWQPTPVGEVTGARKRWEIANAPVGLGFDHVCGTDDDFEFGGTYEPDLPPVRYGAEGYPLCCDPPKRLRGGAAVSARSEYHVTSPYTRGGAASSGRSVYHNSPANYTRGGAGSSGRSDFTNTPADYTRGGAGSSGRSDFTNERGPALRGGAGGGGKSAVRVSDICNGKGKSCQLPAVESVGDWCEFMDGASRADGWYMWPVVVGHHYRFQAHWYDRDEVPWTFYGGVCPDGLVVLTAGTTHVGDIDFAFTAGTGFVWLRVGASLFGPGAMGAIRVIEVP
jgi:hypothetical protein